MHLCSWRLVPWGWAWSMLGLNLLNLLQCPICSKHRESLRNQEVTPKAICYFLDIPGASKFVNIFNKHYFHFL